MRLQDRVTCVTGGGSGIGRATAEAFASEGAKVIVLDLDHTAARDTVDALPGDDHLAEQADVSDSERVSQAFAGIAERYGRLDVLINNAGVDRTPGDGFEKMMETGSLLLGMEDRGFARMLEIHLHGAFFCTREAARIMLPAGKGSIVNLSSIAALGGMGAFHYATAKAGMLGLTRALARELGPRGVRVNAICPGVIDTPMTRAVPEKALSGMLASTPLRRMGEASEVAATAVYLASDDSSFVTGQSLSPNGGVFIG